MNFGDQSPEIRRNQVKHGSGTPRARARQGAFEWQKGERIYRQLGDGSAQER